MTIQLLIALATPVALAITLSLPGWCTIVLGIMPWAICDFIFRNLAPHLLGKGFIFLSFIQVALLIACITRGKLLPTKTSWRHEITTRGWIIGVVFPSLLIAISLGIRGISVEFPSDTSVYFYLHLQDYQLSCASPERTWFVYNTSCNWYYASQRYLWGISQGLGLQQAGHIAGLNTFLLIAASCNFVWSSTRNIALSWLSAFLLLIGFGNQSLSFFHQIGLNGTMPGIALLIASTSSATRLIGDKSCKPYPMIWMSIRTLMCGYFSYLAHGLNAYFTANLLFAAWAAYNSKGRPSRIGMVCIGLLLSILIFLQTLPWNEEIQSALAYPESSRFIHFLDGFWGRFYWYWPAMPNSTLEVSFIIATLIGLCILGLYYGCIIGKPVSLMYSYLPFIVLAEWILPFSSDVIFKLANPDISYRVGWTSLFWILIPIGLWDLHALTGRGSVLAKLIKVTTAVSIFAMAIPVNINGKSNVLNAKTPHLLLSPKDVRDADGSDILAIIPYINELCEQHPILKKGRILSDPYVGFILETRSKCAKPIASRDTAYLTRDSAEEGQFRELRESMASAYSAQKWLADNNISVIVLKSKYPEFISKTGDISKHWQADLVSSYKDLALNRLDNKILTYSGFALAWRINNFLIYKRDPGAE